MRLFAATRAVSKRPQRQEADEMNRATAKWAGRIEDEALLRGQGKFGDDVKPQHTLAAVFVRSPHAHATINRIDTTQALGMPGVNAIITAKSLEGAGLNSVTGAMPHSRLARRRAYRAVPACTRYPPRNACRRPGRPRPGRYGSAGSGCCRDGRHRLHAAGTGDRHRAVGNRCTPVVARTTGQSCP